MTYLILNHNPAYYRSDEVFDHSQVQLVGGVLPGLGLVHDSDELIREVQGLNNFSLTKVQDTFPEKLDPNEAEDEEQGVVHGGRRKCPYQDF